MSKSLGNQVGITEPPDEIYGKVMSVSDETMWSYWTLLTDLRPAEIAGLKAEAASGALHPKAAKMRLAARLVTDFHGDEAARRAGEEFARRFAGASGAVTAEEILLAESDGSAERGIVDILLETGLAPSRNVARQKVREGAVATSKDGRTWAKVDSPASLIHLDSGVGVFLRMGKRFVKVRR
jgi:tyrosyl-tRNA synthetase